MKKKKQKQDLPTRIVSLVAVGVLVWFVVVPMIRMAAFYLMGFTGWMPH